MERDYVIFTDVSADIDKQFAIENDIRFVPMNYTIAGEERLCETLEPEDVLKQFYDGQRGGDLTQTSQITPQKYIDMFQPILEEGKDVLYVSLSSGLTKTFESVQLAKSELEETVPQAKLHPVDSLSATAGMGLLIEGAVKNRSEGMSIEENVKWLENNRSRVHLCFMVDDLMYLKRGGRIPATSAVIGTALNLKPILKVDVSDGKLITVEKKRGEKTAIKNLVDRFMEERDETKAKDERIYIVHGDCKERAKILEEKLLGINPEAKITEMCMSPIIGAHTGPGMLAVIHFSK